MNASTGDETKKSGLGRDFWMYRLGNIASAFGDSCATIALAWWVLDKTGSPAQMSAILAPAMFVRVFLLPICGPFGDRFSRKWLVALGDIWRLIIAITLALFVINDYFSLPIILTLFVANSLGTAFSSAGASAMLPKLVPKELLGKAIGQTQIVEAMAGVAGGVAAGGLVSAVGVHGAFFFDAFSFAISALTVLLIKANTHPSGDLKESAHKKNALATWATDLASGFQFVRKARFLVFLIALCMIFNLVLAPIGIILPVLVKEGIGLPAWYLGALESTLCLGMVVGAWSLGHFTKKITPEMKITGGTLLMAIAFLLMPTSPHMALPLSMMFLFGMGNTIFNIPLQTQMALAIPDSYRARFDSILGFGCGLAAPLGMAMAGSMIERFGTPTLLVFMGSVFVCLTPLLLVNKEFIRFMRLSPEDAPQYFDKGSIHSSQAGTPAVVEVGFVDATSDSGKI